MAKISQFTENELINAVQSYADANPGITLTARKIAAWANTHIPGMEQLKPYHLTRPSTRKDRNGKIISTVKPCTRKIEEINHMRAPAMKAKTNVLLTASDTERFFALPKERQIILILETRRTVEELQKKVTYLERKTRALQTESISQAEIQEKLRHVSAAQGKLSAEFQALKKTINDARCRQILASIGITENDIDLDTYVNSLTADIDQLLIVTASDTVPPDKEHPRPVSTTVHDLMNGIEF